MSRLACDASTAIPFPVRTHPSHEAVRRHLRQREAVLTAHSLAETYSVLTRLPGDARVAPRDVVRLITSNFGRAIAPDADTLDDLPRVLATAGVLGGAVYDALVALAARASDVPLATRDARALGTYGAIGVTVEVIAQ